MKRIIPSATKNAMYARAENAHACISAWAAYLGESIKDQMPPLPENMGKYERFTRKDPEPEFITIPYADALRMCEQLGIHARELGKFLR